MKNTPLHQSTIAREMLRLVWKNSKRAANTLCNLTPEFFPGKTYTVEISYDNRELFYSLDDFVKTILVQALKDVIETQPETSYYFYENCYNITKREERFNGINLTVFSGIGCATELVHNRFIFSCE